MCCSPWGHKESDTTGQLSNDHHQKKMKELCQVLYRLSRSILHFLNSNSGNEPTG